MKLLNAFSLNMLEGFPSYASFEEKTLEEARYLLADGFTSAVGHESTAAVFADVLGLDVEFNRSTVVLKKYEGALIGQYRGPRLEEGTTHLPEGATIQWLLVTIV